MFRDCRDYKFYFRRHQLRTALAVLMPIEDGFVYGLYKACGELYTDVNTNNANQLFRLQNQYFDAETGLHYNLYNPKSALDTDEKCCSWRANLFLNEMLIAILQALRARANLYVKCSASCSEHSNKPAIEIKSVTD